MWKPIKQFLPYDPEELICVIPHKKVFEVPFYALMDPDGHYVIENHTITIGASIRTLEVINNRTGGIIMATYISLTIY